MFIKLFNINETSVGFFVALPYILSAILWPFVGIIFDKIGHKSTWLIVSFFFLTFGHILFLFINNK